MKMFFTQQLNRSIAKVVLVSQFLLPIQRVYGQTFQAPLSHRATPARATAPPKDPYISPLANKELESQAQFYGALLQKLGTLDPKGRLGSDWSLLFLEHQAKKYENHTGIPLHESRPLGPKQNNEYFNEFDNRAALKEVKGLKQYIENQNNGGNSSRVLKTAKGVGGALKWAPDPTAKTAGTVISTGAEVAEKTTGFFDFINDMETERKVKDASTWGGFSRSALLDPMEGLTREDAVRIARRALSVPGFRAASEEVGVVPQGFFDQTPEQRARLTDKYSLRVSSAEHGPVSPSLRKRETARSQSFSNFQGNFRLFTDDEGNISMGKIEEKNRYLGHLMEEIIEKHGTPGASSEEEKSEESSPENENGESAEKDKEATLQTLKDIQAGIDFAETLVGDNKTLQAGLAIGSAGIAVAAALYMTPGIGQIAAIGTAVAILLKKLFSIFSSGEGADEKIIAMLEELQKKLEAFSNRMENRHQDLRMHIASLRLHLNQEFDAMKRLMRGEFANLKERSQHIESLTRTSALITLHEGKATQEYFRQLKREQESRLRPQLFRPTTHASVMKSQGNNAPPNPLDLVDDFQDAFKQVVECAAVFSKAPIETGLDLYGETYDRLVPKLRDGVLTDAEKSRIRGLFIPVRNGMSDVGILGSALKELNFNLNSHRYVNSSEYDGTTQTNLNEYQGPMNLFTWLDCTKLWVEVVEKAYGNEPEAKTYKTLVEIVDPDRKFQKLLMDSGYETLHSYQALAPVDSEGRPSLQRVQNLIQNLHEAQEGLASAIDNDFKAKLLNKAHTLKGYDPRRPFTDLNVARQKRASAQFVVSNGVISACPGYIPLKENGEETVKPQFAVSDAVTAELFSNIIPKEVLLARDILGGEIKWCYRAIEGCPSHTKLRLVEAEDDREGYDETNIDVESTGKICIEIEGAYENENIGHHVFFKQKIEDNEERFLGSKRYNPLYSLSPSELTKGFDGGYKGVPETDSDRPLYDQALREAKDQESVYRGHFMGFQYRGAGERKDGVYNQLSQLVSQRWGTLQNGLLKGQGSDLLSNEERNETLKALESATRAQLMEETMRYLEEDLKPDSQEKLGKIGRAIDQVETARALLISGLYFALGEEVHSRPEIQAVVQQIPSGSGVVDKALQYTDVNHAREVVKKSMEPTSELLRMLSDPSRTPIVRKWNGLEELLRDKLEPLYMARQAHANVDAPRLRRDEIKEADFVSRTTTPQDTLLLDREMLHLLVTEGDLKGNVSGVNRLTNFLYLNAEKLKFLQKEDLNSIVLELAGIYLQLAIDPNGPRLSDEEMGPFLDKLLTRGILAQRPTKTNAALMKTYYQDLHNPLKESLTHEEAKARILEALNSTGYLTAETSMREIDAAINKIAGTAQNYATKAEAFQKEMQEMINVIGGNVTQLNRWEEEIRGLAPQMNNNNGPEVARAGEIRPQVESLYLELEKQFLIYKAQSQNLLVNKRNVVEMAVPLKEALQNSGTRIKELRDEVERLVGASHGKLHNYRVEEERRRQALDKAVRGKW